MTKLKGIDKINNVLNDFLKPFGCVASMADEFCYWTNRHIIDYTLVVSEEFDNLFKGFVEDVFTPSVSMDIFMWSFLHELGHHMTDIFLTEEEQEISMGSKAYLESDDCNWDYAERFNTYACLPDEYTATQWAVNYVEENLDKVKELWDNFRFAVLEFYKINNIEED